MGSLASFINKLNWYMEHEGALFLYQSGLSSLAISDLIKLTKISNARFFSQYGASRALRCWFFWWSRGLRGVAGDSTGPVELGGSCGELGGGGIFSMWPGSSVCAQLWKDTCGAVPATLLEDQVRVFWWSRAGLGMQPGTPPG